MFSRVANRLANTPSSWDQPLTLARANVRLCGKTEISRNLLQHDKGVSVSCPELPGCHSQGANVEDALANIEDAIRGYIDLYGEPETRCEIREMEVFTA